MFGIVALGALVLATLLVMEFEAARGGGSSFRVAFPVEDQAGPGAQALSFEGQSATKIAPITLANVTRARFVLTWTDDVGDPDTFRLAVADPGGISRSVEGSDGTLSILFDGLSRAPPDQRILAASAEEAAARVAARSTSTAAEGEWTVTVTLASAPGTRVGGVEVQPDGKNAWELATVLSAYHADVRRG